MSEHGTESMHGDHPRGLKDTEASLDERLRKTFEPQPGVAQALARRALRGIAEPRPTRGGLGLRLAMAGALSAALAAVLTVSVWQAPSPENPPQDPPAVAETTPILISNESGFVTVTTAGSQWIVLPGDNDEK